MDDKIFVIFLLILKYQLDNTYKWPKAHNFVHGIGILVDKLWFQPSHTKKARSILWCPGNRQFFRTGLAKQLSLSGKSPVFPDKVGRKVFSVLHNRYGLKVMGFVEWSVDGLAQLCPRNRHFGGQTMIPTQLCPPNGRFGGQRRVDIKKMSH